MNGIIFAVKTLMPLPKTTIRKRKLMTDEDALATHEGRDLPPLGFHDRRRHQRVCCVLIVDYAVKDRAYRDFLINLSDSGAWIMTQQNFSVEERVVVAIAVGSEICLKTSGRIVRSSPEGIGVIFDERIPAATMQDIPKSTWRNRPWHYGMPE